MLCCTSVLFLKDIKKRKKERKESILRESQKILCVYKYLWYVIFYFDEFVTEEKLYNTEGWNKGKKTKIVRRRLCSTFQTRMKARI